MSDPELFPASPLAWGRELKRSDLLPMVRGIWSPLAWGRELKLKLQLRAARRGESPLAWGRELKLYSIKIRSDLLRVAPCVGA